jgi:hypothetical protein
MSDGGSHRLASGPIGELKLHHRLGSPAAQPMRICCFQVPEQDLYTAAEPAVVKAVSFAVTSRVYKLWMSTNC